MRKLLTIFIFIFFLTAVKISSQQNYNFEHLSIPDGLSNTAVWQILQDQYGFLWISTADGLNRYDGYTFKIYKNDPGNPKSLPINDIRSILLDNTGTMWVGTNGNGICRYNRADESFETFLVDSSRISSVANTIFKLYQDSKNRIWVGTAMGIYQFDPLTKKFTRIFYKDGNNKQPTQGISFALTETSSGEIYSQFFYKGLTKYNETTGLFEWVDVSPSDTTIFEQKVILNMMEDKTGKIWICSQDGFYNYDPHTGAFNEIKLYNKINNPNNNGVNATTDVFQDNNGYLWINTAIHGIYRYNMKSGEVSNLNQIDNQSIINPNDFLWFFYKDSFGILWIATQNNGIYKLDFQKEPFKLFPNPVSQSNASNKFVIESIYKFPSDNNVVWLGSNQGLIKYNLQSKTYTTFKHQDKNPKSLIYDVIRSIRPGSGHTLWIGTSNGLSLMDCANNTFTNYELVDKSKHYSVSYNNIFNLSEDDYGNVWTATGNGVVKFETKNNLTQFIPVIHTRTYDQELISMIDSLVHKNDIVAKITEVGDYQDLKKDFTLDKPKDVLIVSVGEGDPRAGGTMFDYGFLMNSKKDTVWRNPNYYKTFYMSGATKNRISIGMLKLEKGTYTLRYVSDDSHSYGKWNQPPPIDSTWWGVQVFDLSNSNVNYFKSLVAESESKPFIKANYITKVEYQNDGSVLIGAFGGLFKYDIRKNTVADLFTGNDSNLNQNLKNVEDLFVDKDKNAWLATDGGLVRYNQGTKQIKILYDKDGLPSNYLLAIEEDTYGNLWLSTLNGISKFNKDVDHPIFINYDVRDGLQGYTFNRQASFESETGDLYFAGQNGFNVFHSSNINKQVPIITITQLKISNEPVYPNSDNSPLTKSILDTKNLELSYGQNNISFEFSAIHFSRPEKNQYAYMLEGFDKGWIYDNRKFASYTNLPPGNYVFRVIGSNGDGVWNKKGASINITVLPPLWRTWWAYSLYVLIFAGIVFGLDRFLRRRVLAKEKNAAQLREANLRAQIAEAETARKTKELEEARNLQLSMLPKQLPKLPHLDIAVYMKTATEVGGDYYDFHVHPDGTLTVILGDATGHGMMSGMMVSIMKSLFMSDRTNKKLKPFFENTSMAIKDMQLGRLMMALTCVQISNNRLITANADMPPLIIYRNNTQTVEEISINNLPLGALKEIDYDVKEVEIEQGDTLLMMSDGFAELKNRNEELFGYRKTRNIFEEVARKAPENIIQFLKEEGIKWTDDNDPEDDVTFVVIKVK